MYLPWPRWTGLGMVCESSDICGFDSDWKTTRIGLAANVWEPHTPQ